MSSDFFKHDHYFIDEKVALFANTYKVYNENGDQIGTIKQMMPGYLKVLSLFLNKAVFPFKLDIINAEEQVLVTIKRGWTLFISKIEIIGPEKNVIARINQKFKMFKPTFNIVDANGNSVATITGDWKAWNFVITDNNNNQIGTVTKKWGGVLREAFTTADKYIVSINPGVDSGINRIAVVATAVTIDMVLKESK